jgi:hypothetical protein
MANGDTLYGPYRTAGRPDTPQPRITSPLAGSGIGTDPRLYGAYPTAGRPTNVTQYRPPATATPQRPTAAPHDALDAAQKMTFGAPPESTFGSVSAFAKPTQMSLSQLYDHFGVPGFQERADRQLSSYVDRTRFYG